MKRLFVMVALSATTFCSAVFAQKQIFEAPNLKTVLKTHKLVAILPLRVTISYKKLPKNYNAADNDVQQKQEGVNMQSGMYTYLLRKSSDYYVSFQDVQRTNVLLKQAGVYDKLESLTADSIARILKVDAVIQSSYAYERTASEAAAIAKTLVFGFGGSTASGSLTMQINSGSDGNLLWRFYKEMNEGAFTTADELMERMMKKVARNFPYEK